MVLIDLKRIAFFWWLKSFSSRAYILNLSLVHLQQRRQVIEEMQVERAKELCTKVRLSLRGHDFSTFFLNFHCLDGKKGCIQEAPMWIGNDVKLQKIEMVALQVWLYLQCCLQCLCTYCVNCARIGEKERKWLTPCAEKYLKELTFTVVCYVCWQLPSTADVIFITALSSGGQCSESTM